MRIQEHVLMRIQEHVLMRIQEHVSNAYTGACF